MLVKGQPESDSELPEACGGAFPKGKLRGCAGTQDESGRVPEPPDQSEQ